MTRNQLQVIEEYVQKFQGPVSFRVREGVLRDSLLQTVLEGEPVRDEGPVPGELEVRLRPPAGEDEPATLTVAHPGLSQPAECAVSRLDEQALEELIRSLARISERYRNQRGAKIAVISREGEPDCYDKMGASARLKVTPEWLKSVIPCSNYTYDEIEGKKYLRDYYWSVELIENLFRFKNTKIAPEDLKYVADQCCFGDLDWAKDLIARLKSPNRAEPAPKEPAPKQQPRQGRPASRDRMHPRHRTKKPPRES